MIRVTFLPINVTVFAHKNQSVLDLAFENDILLEHNCGGLCACTSCRVLILKGSRLLKEKSTEENFLLQEVELNSNNMRLGCQCFICEGNEEEIIVEIPQTTSE